MHARRVPAGRVGLRQGCDQTRSLSNEDSALLVYTVLREPSAPCTPVCHRVGRPAGFCACGARRDAGPTCFARLCVIYVPATTSLPFAYLRSMLADIAYFRSWARRSAAVTASSMSRLATTRVIASSAQINVKAHRSRTLLWLPSG